LFFIPILGNHAVVYCILREHKSFRQLANLRIRAKKEVEKDSSQERAPPSPKQPGEDDWVPTDEWVSRMNIFN
jgi:hypothetical protein